MIPPGPPTAAQTKKYLDDFCEWLIENGEKRVTEDVKTKTFTQDELGEISMLKSNASLMTRLTGLENTDHIVIAGGCFTSWLLNETAKDIDIFVLHPENHGDYTHHLVRTTIMAKFPQVKDTTELYIRDNDKITEVFTDDKSSLQFIFTKYKTREELIQHFDYVHTMISFQKDKLYLTRKTFDAIKRRHLIVNNKKMVKPWRTEKFKARGFTFPDDAAVGNPMSVQQFNDMIRQPVNVGSGGNSWQSAARINPNRVKVNPHTTALYQKHIDKLIKDLEENGQ